jgi:hypothetical protein
VSGGIVRGVEHELHYAFAIPQINKDKPAMVTARCHPTPQSNLAAGISSPQLAAVIGAPPRRQR